MFSIKPGNKLYSNKQSYIKNRLRLFNSYKLIKGIFG